MLRILLAAAAVLLSSHALAKDTDPCTRFTWNVSHELAVMRHEPQKLAAATKPTGNVPRLQVNQSYELVLASQKNVTFAVTPGKPTLPDNANAGIVRFRTNTAGRYRVSITSAHWIDVVDANALITSRDFQGARGCERPRKIVEYDLPAGRELTLQLSGGSEAAVIIAVTTAADAPAG